MTHVKGSKLLTKMEDLFGYGLIDDGKKVDEWWDLDSPPCA